MDGTTARPTAYSLLMWAEAETRPHTQAIEAMPHYLKTSEYPQGIPLHDGETGALVLRNKDGKVLDILRRIIK